MTIDEAIKHCKELVRDNREDAKYAIENELHDAVIKTCTKCAEEHEQLAKWLEELKEYKQLEEQGLLLKLPCKFGTIVYVVDTRCKDGEEPAEGCDTVDCEKCFYNRSYTILERKVDCWLMCNLITKDYSPYVLNDNVFLTKEAAEEKLKKLKEGSEKLDTLTVGKIDG